MGRVFGGASTNRGAELGAKMSPTALCSLWSALSGKKEGLHSSTNIFLSTGHTLKAGNKNLSREDVAKNAICG